MSDSTHDAKRRRRADVRARLRRLLRDFVESAAPNPYPAADAVADDVAPDWASVGRTLATRDVESLAERRARDVTRRRVASATGTVIADVAPPPAPTTDRRLTPLQSFAVTMHTAAGRVPRFVERVVSVAVDELADVVRRGTTGAALGLLLCLMVAAVRSRPALAQDAKIRDLTIAEGAAPIRLVGYGLAVGLDGTGDKGSNGGGMTVQSVVNALRNFNVQVPAEAMKMRNVAAVLVTAEVSPYLRSGGRFDVHVSSLGDARSLRGGILWMTPLVAEAGGRPLAVAQGTLVVSESTDPRDRAAAPTIETTVRMPSGGQLEADLPRPTFAGASRLLLKEPDIGTAAKIAAAINAALGPKSASVEDPGAVALTLPDSGDRAVALSKVRELSVRPERVARLVIDGRDGTVVAGGDMPIGEAVISRGIITLSIGGAAKTASDTANAFGDLRVPAGTSVQKIATALHAVQTPPAEIAAIFVALREVGALAAEVIVR